MSIKSQTLTGRPVRWGLLGAGVILDRWLKGAMQAEDTQIAAVASRTIETAKRQAEKYGIPEALTYDEILARKDIDIMYIPVPHMAHKDLALRAMEAGFNVLVEKPAGVSAKEWDEMTACAAKNHVFLMEAVWTNCFPIMKRLREELDSGRIGDVRDVQASFAFRVGDDYQGRLTDPAQAGGALLDVGVYALHFAQMVYQAAPEKLLSLASMDTDDLHLKVDEQCAIIGQYKNGALSVLQAAIRTGMPDTAWIYGTKGYIRIPVFWKPSLMEIFTEDGTETVSMPVSQKLEGIEDEGYQYEVRHVNECLRQGLAESPLVPHAVTAAVLSQCDALRAQWGLRYPFEQDA